MKSRREAKILRDIVLLHSRPNCVNDKLTCDGVEIFCVRISALQLESRVNIVQKRRAKSGGELAKRRQREKHEN